MIPYGLSNIFDFVLKHIYIHFKYFKYHANTINYFFVKELKKKTTYTCTKTLYFYSLFLLKYI